MSRTKEFSPQSPIETKAEINEHIGRGIYKATLPNGKLIHVHTPANTVQDQPYRKGELVLLELNPYDFSRGRIKIL
ncbi:MAG: hypothetical protein VYB61_04400 [Verrucomicrobiota bacterium]|nr:hypothetical protein [Verrucomicrobiota bacterium]